MKKIRGASCLIASISLLHAASITTARAQTAAPIALSPQRGAAQEQEGPASREPALTLAECYALALKQSETVAIQRERLKATESRFLQALSGALPRASFELSEKRQDGSGGSAFTLKEIPERRFAFSQPLFSGFKEFAAIAGARAEQRERRHELARAGQLLFVDVANAFYLVLEERADLLALETIRTALADRIDELKSRERLGRSRPSEVVGAEAQLRRVEAELELVKSRDITARQLLEFLTGRAPLETLDSAEPAPVSLAGEEDYTAKAGVRPDVQAAEEAWRVAKHESSVARATFFPTVNVESNYYTKRIGVSSGVDWDVLLKVSAPIFQGGQAVGASREAASTARQAQLQFERTKREATLDIRETYARLRAALAREAALHEALEAAEENYRLQTEDYRRNLVNNLEVLQALQALEDARREMSAAHYATRRLFAQLRAATGDAP